MKDLSQHEIEQILQLINGSTYDQVSIEVGDLKIQVARNGAGVLPGAGSVSPRAAAERADVSTSPAAAPAPAVNHPTPPAAVAPKADLGLHVVKAPMLGVFYRASQPEADPFVKPGARVSATDTICLLEVMKLFQSISAGVEGTIKEILVESGALVEFGQPLFLMELAGADLKDLEDPETHGRSDLV